MRLCGRPCRKGDVLVDALRARRGASSWPRQLLWMTAAMVVSAILTIGCIVAGATAAMALEVGFDPLASRLVNAGALLIMASLYSGLLLLIMRALAARYVVPGATWVGLGLFAAIWTVVGLTSAAGRYSPAPAIINASGALVCWLVVGRFARPGGLEPLEDAGGRAHGRIRQHAAR